MRPSRCSGAGDGGSDMAVVTAPAGKLSIEDRAALGPPRVLADIALVAQRNLLKVRRSPGPDSMPLRWDRLPPGGTGPRKVSAPRAAWCSAVAARRRLGGHRRRAERCTRP